MRSINSSYFSQLQWQIIPEKKISGCVLKRPSSRMRLSRGPLPRLGQLLFGPGVIKNKKKKMVETKKKILKSQLGLKVIKKIPG